MPNVTTPAHTLILQVNTVGGCSVIVTILQMIFIGDLALASGKKCLRELDTPLLGERECDRSIEGKGQREAIASSKATICN